ncbi:MAG: class I SAM-dependent methyltransferase [Chloroflexi bacterium]|nr:class I SAM-dependent methyltransferase [Chloroflexota bacterium]
MAARSRRRRYSRRSGYAPDALAQLAAVLGIRSGTLVVDVGAGTGKLTRQLLNTGARLVAVEPVAAMRAQFRRVLPDVAILEGTTEALPLPDASVDAAVVGQAWHWFDAPAALAVTSFAQISASRLLASFPQAFTNRSSVSAANPTFTKSSRSSNKKSSFSTNSRTSLRLAFLIFWVAGVATRKSETAAAMTRASAARRARDRLAAVVPVAARVPLECDHALASRTCYSPVLRRRRP